MRTFILAVILLVIPATLNAQQKITNDPNATVRQTQDQNINDSRLSKKITYDSGYKRLHAVVEDLSRISGITISCGNNKKDWQIRDIPIVSCIKDLPVGEALSAIANATHTIFISEQIAGDSEKSYRINRTANQRQEMETYFKTKYEWEMARLKWSWNALAAYGKSAEIPGIEKQLWFTSRVIASLGPQGMEKILNGDAFRFDANDPNVGPIISELCQYIIDHNQDSGDEGYVPTSEDLETAVLKFKLVDSNSQFGPNLDFRFGYFMIGEHHVGSWMGSGWNAGQLESKIPGLPPYPKYFTIPLLKNEVRSLDLVMLARKEAWDRPLLQSKLKLEAPKDTPNPTFAQLITALSAASGCSIVAEDFCSQLSSTSPYLGGSQPRMVFKTDTTIADSIRNGIFPGMIWFLHEKEKLILGQVFDWRYQHKEMPSEDYLDDLKNKLNGPGVDFDDAVHLPDVSRNWISYSRDFSCFSRVQDVHDSLWQLYYYLKPEDKELAQSSSGLPFVKFDPAWLMSFFTEQKKRSPIDFEPALVHDIPLEQRVAMAQKNKETWEVNSRIFSDPQVISSMILRVMKTPAKSRVVITPDLHSTTSAPPELKLFEYSVELDFIIDGEKHTYKNEYYPLQFPIRSPEREAEILKTSGK